LLQVANKPQLYYSIKQLENAGFARNNIFVAITAKDLEVYESDEGIIPIDSRLPPQNYIQIEDFKSSVDTMRKACVAIDKMQGLPRYLCVIYVDVVSCGVLSKLAEINRIRDCAFLSVYGPRDVTVDNLPAAEDSCHQQGEQQGDKVTKLVFLSGKGLLNDQNLRKLYLTIDTSDYEDDTIPLSRRVLSQTDHIEVSSDLDDQGVFLLRDDMVLWIMRNSEEKCWASIRDQMIPELLKNMYREEFAEDAECLAYIDPNSTCRLDSIKHYYYAHLNILNGKLNPGITRSNPKEAYERSAQSLVFEEKESNKPRSISTAGFDEAAIYDFNLCSTSIVGEHVSRFNEKDRANRVATGAEESKDRKNDSESGSSTSEKTTQTHITRSFVGSKCRFEYDYIDEKQKAWHTRVINSIIHEDCEIRLGCKITNCILARGVEVGEKCTLTNCIVGPDYKLKPDQNFTGRLLLEDYDLS